MLVPIPAAADYTQAKKASDAVVAMLAELVEARQAAPADDLVSGLISARDGDERLSTQELLSTIFQLIVAGHDTTTSLPGNSVVALLRNAAQLAHLRSEAAIEEFLRYDAPVPHSTFRYAIEPGQIGDSVIPAGAQVIICLAAANRDADRVRPPVVLDIDRAGTRHLAPGHGIDHCLGAPLPRMEGQRILGSLLHRFPNSASPSPPPSCTGATATGRAARPVRAARHSRPAHNQLGC
jgi:cytochrome P450